MSFTGAADVREVSRELVAGSWSAVSIENLRQSFMTREQALAYVREVWADLRVSRSLYAVVRYTYAALPHTRRGSWDALSPATRKRYAASRQAKEEARAHGLTVEQWYSRAPDLRAFRGHARGRPSSAAFPRDSNFTVYIVRDYRNTGQSPAVLSARTKRAYRQRRGRK